MISKNWTDDLALGSGEWPLLVNALNTFEPLNLTEILIYLQVSNSLWLWLPCSDQSRSAMQISHIGVSIAMLRLEWISHIRVPCPAMSKLPFLSSSILIAMPMCSLPSGPHLFPTALLPLQSPQLWPQKNCEQITTPSILKTPTIPSLQPTLHSWPPVQGFSKWIASSPATSILTPFFYFYSNSFLPHILGNNDQLSHSCLVPVHLNTFFSLPLFIFTHNFFTFFLDINVPYAVTWPFDGPES